MEVKEMVTNLHGVRRKSNGPNIINYPECFAVGLSQVKTRVDALSMKHKSTYGLPNVVI